MTQRSVYCCKNDRRWTFYESGQPLPEEDIATYAAKRKRDRLNEQRMLELLERLGARPWNDDFYSAGEAFRIERVRYPNTISQRQFAQFACKRTRLA